MRTLIRPAFPRHPLFLLPLLLLFLGTTPAPPDAAEIARRHVEAIGGKARWQRVQSLVIKGSSSFASFVWVWKGPGKVRTEERDDQYSGKTLVTAFDGTSGWISNPFRGPDYGVPHKLTPEELRAWQTGLILRSDLLDLPAQGAQLRLLGQEAVGGQPAWKLSLERTGYDPVTLWIDAKTFLLVQRARKTKSPWGGEGTNRTRFGDYRNVGGVLIAHSTGETRYVVEVNPPIDDALFRPPQPLK
ncbi:MAG: hypothetical protein ABI779_22980 [Acidobacteriota bacterium]